MKYAKKFYKQWLVLKNLIGFQDLTIFLPPGHDKQKWLKFHKFDCNLSQQLLYK